MKPPLKGVAVIPARGGSKRIPKKNLQLVSGKMMLEIVIESILKSDLISDVIISTDDEAILKHAESFGAITNGLRPAELSGDDVPTAPVINYELDRYTANHPSPAFVLVAYPTSIFLTARRIDEMVLTLFRSPIEPELVFTATPFPSNIERAWFRASDGSAQMVNPQLRNAQGQNLGEFYYDCGQAYVSYLDAWKKWDLQDSLRSEVVVIDSWEGWDINTPQDLIIARLFYENMEFISDQRRTLMG